MEDGMSKILGLFGPSVPVSKGKSIKRKRKYQDRMKLLIIFPISLIGTKESLSP